jgi:hypothetical protein
MIYRQASFLEELLAKANAVLESNPQALRLENLPKAR